MQPNKLDASYPTQKTVATATRAVVAPTDSGSTPDPTAKTILLNNKISKISSIREKVLNHLFSFNEMFFSLNYSLITLEPKQSTFPT